MLSTTFIFAVYGYVLSERKNRLSITLAQYARMIGKPLFKALFCTLSLRMRKQYDSLDVARGNDNTPSFQYPLLKKRKKNISTICLSHKPEKATYPEAAGRRGHHLQRKALVRPAGLRHGLRGWPPNLHFQKRLHL